MAIILKDLSPPPDPVAQEKAIRLKNAILFNTFKWSEAKEVDRLTDHVLTMLEPHLRNYRGDNVSICLKVVLLNLFEANKSDPSRYVAYHRSKDFEAYKVNKRKSVKNRRANPLGIGYKPLLNAIDALVSADLVEHFKGYPSKDFTGHGVVARIKAKPILTDMFQGYGVTFSMVGITPKAEFIEKRGKKTKDKNGNKKKGKLLVYQDTAAIKKMRANLQRINDVLANNKILLKITDQEWLELNKKLSKSKDSFFDDEDHDKSQVDYSRRVLKRVFNDGSFKKGGRFYGGWWLSIPKEYRKFITIDGKTTVELDYSAIHPSIAYAQEQIDLPEGYDAYTLEGFEGDERLRGLVKTIMVKVFNAGSRDAVLEPLKLNTEYFELELPPAIGKFNVLFDLIEAKHHRIKDEYFYKDRGKDLQFIDSQLAERVMLTFIERSGGAAILPEHDSFTVSSDHAELLKDCMKDCSLDVIGVSLKVKAKETMQEIESNDNPEQYKIYNSFLFS